MATTSNEKYTLAINEEEQQQQPYYANNMSMDDSPPPPHYGDLSPSASNTSQTLMPNEKEDIDTLSRAPTPLPGHPAKTLKFHHASFPWRDVNISSASTGQPAYHAEISEASRKKPDVTLRAPGRDGACVGRSHFRLSRSMRAGVGKDELECEWCELTSSSLLSKGAFDFHWRGRNLRLQRTHAKEHGVEGVLKKVNLNHFKVVDVEASSMGGERVVAVYVSETFHPGWMKGTLTLSEGVEEDLEVLIVLGVVGWREKMRRRAAYSSGGGGGNGGGG